MEYWNQFHAYLLTNDDLRQVFIVVLTWVVAKVVGQLVLRLAPLKYHYVAVLLSDKIIQWILAKLKIPQFEKVVDPETNKTKIVNVAKKPDVEVKPENVA